MLDNLKDQRELSNLLLGQRDMCVGIHLDGSFLCSAELMILHVLHCYPV